MEPQRRPTGSWLPAFVMVLAAACATSRPRVALVPTLIGAASGDTVVFMGPATAVEALPAVEPGRFDTGKMWTFENPPLDYFQEAYTFRPGPDWLNRVRLAALRLPNCTASFVSPGGLVLTNHHCARESATAVSREGEDLLTNGFLAQQPEDERRVPGLYVDQLVEIRDVTADIQSALDPRLTEEQQVAARDAHIEDVQRQVSGETGLRCDVTSLYHGGRYSSYCYRRYDDVRLVFVPEVAIGYFGGDPDNFTYPRYAFDVSLFRVYRDGRPLVAEAYLPWSDSGAVADEPVFVVGNPGSTSRLNTVAQLEYRRDHQYPFTVRLISTRADILKGFMERYPDQRSAIINDYFSLTNALKAYTGELQGLRNRELMGRKREFERRFRQAVAADSTLTAQYGDLWDEIADLRAQIAEVAPRLNALNQGGILRSRTLEVAASMIQYAQAASGGFAPDSMLRQVRDQIVSTGIDRRLDAQILAAQLRDAVDLVGSQDPFVEEALAGRPATDAATAAAAIVNGSAIPDSAQRVALLDAPRQLLGSSDPALSLARNLLPRLQAVVRQFQSLTAAEEVRTARLARALFEVHGTAIPPDATFTLRLADGVVKSYPYNGTEAPHFTTFHGMYDRHFSSPRREEWALPRRWLAPPPAFDRSTPLNLVSTNDIIGGNSGSPLINTRGQLVGLIFDGNIESLPGDFIYTTERARSVSVHSAGILEALRDLYGAMRIVAEIEQARRN